MRFLIALFSIMFAFFPDCFADDTLDQNGLNKTFDENREKHRSRFSPFEWKEAIKDENPPGKYLSRPVLFRNFLKKYDLIGMSHEQVKKLLGNEDTNATYLMNSGMNGGYGLFIVYENEKVKGWQFRDFLSRVPTQLITTNVLWTGQSGTPDKFHSKY